MSGRPKAEPVRSSGDEGSGVASGITMPKGMQTGALLDGKYSLGRIIGSGAFGLVFEGKNIELDEKVAIKALRPEIAVDTAMVGRFAREAKSSAGLKSEYVCSVYDVGTSRDGVPYIVMEYLEGQDLGTILEKDGPFGPRTAVEYALQMCEALAVAHAKGIVHRDIKPENLMITEHARGMRILKVLDFGISKAALGGSVFGAELPVVKTTNLVGTPLYMSPEQVRSSGGVDVRSDIWSVGMVLYEILAGVPAFEGASITEICASILETKPKPIELYRNDLPAGLVNVIKKCLEKNVKDRYQNVAELAIALMPFGPKRSRLNVERAVTILQSVGQVNENIQLDSAPPPSSDLSISQSQRIEIPRPSSVSSIPALPPSSSANGLGSVGSLGLVAASPSSSEGIATLDEIRRSAAKKKRGWLIAVLMILVAIAGAVAIVFGGAFLKKRQAAQQITAPNPNPTTTTTTTSPAPSESAAATTPTPTSTALTPPEPTSSVAVVAAPVTRPTTTAPTARPAAHPPIKTGPAKPTAANTSHAAPPATTTATPPPSPPPPSSASPSNTGRTFRREL